MATHDLRAEIRFKNQRLYEALKREFPNERGGINYKFAAQVIGVNVATLYAFGTLHYSPYKIDGAFRPSAIKIAEYVEEDPAEIFPESLYRLQLPRLIVKTFDSPEILSLQEAQAQHLLPPAAFELDSEAEPDTINQRLDEALRSLSPRQEKVLRLRFGLETGKPETLDAVAAKFAVGRERIRQIENRGLIRLRHPARAKFLRKQRDSIPEPYCPACERLHPLGLCPH